MKTVYKNILKSIFFITGLVLLLFLTSELFRPKYSENAEEGADPLSEGIACEPEHTIDVLIIGDSEAFNSIIPVEIWDDYGITSYVCATPLQKLSCTEKLLSNTFEAQSPKLVILETDAIFTKVSFNDALSNKAELVFPIFNYHDRWKFFSCDDPKLIANHTSQKNSKGYQISKDVVPADASKYMEESSEIEPIDSLNRSYVESLKEYCEENGAEFMLLSTPSTRNWNAKRHNSMEKLAKELDIDYIDMNTLQQEIKIDWLKDSRDGGDHLNLYGAQKATDYLGRYLNETGKFESHKSDSAYESWEEESEKWNTGTEVE
jgi:hypothetical protein